MFWLDAHVSPQGCPDGPHRGPEGPNEDLSQCVRCLMPSWCMRPEDEQFGLHLEDCSLPRRHTGYCEPGGSGHPPAKKVRGWWPGFEADVAAARARFEPTKADDSA